MVYIQANNDSIPHHFDAACAMYGCIEQCIDYKLITYEKVIEFKSLGTLPNIVKNNLFVGSVEFMDVIFESIGKTPRVPINSNRAYKTEKLGEVRFQISKDKKLFVKPFKIKLFTGLVVDKYNISSLREFGDELEVMVYPVIDKIKSEWRLYIENNKIVDARNYSGEFRINPNYEYAFMVIQEYKHMMPICYTMDLAMCDNVWNHTFVVEFNDMWAIGNYGIPNDLYLSMLRKRYFEIIKS